MRARRSWLPSPTSDVIGESTDQGVIDDLIPRARWQSRPDDCSQLLLRHPRGGNLRLEVTSGCQSRRRLLQDCGRWIHINDSRCQRGIQSVTVNNRGTQFAHHSPGTGNDRIDMRFG